MTFPVTVAFGTASGTATENDDYERTSGTLTFSADGTQFVRVPIRGDAASEGRETFLLQLTDASNAAIVQSTGTGSIFDDERNVVSIGDAFLLEGDNGEANMFFVVTLQHPATSAFSSHIYARRHRHQQPATEADFIAQNSTI